MPLRCTLIFSVSLLSLAAAAAAAADDDDYYYDDDEPCRSHLVVAS